MPAKFFLCLLLFIYAATASAHSSSVRKISGKSYMHGKLIIVPKHETWIFEPGSTLLFDEGARFLIYGSIKILGEVKKVTLTSSKGTWLGVDFVGYENIPQFRYTEFSVPDTLYAEKIVNGLILDKISNPDSAAIRIDHDHLILDKIEIHGDVKTPLMTIQNSEVIIGNTILRCAGGAQQIVADKSLLYMDNVEINGESETCSNMITSRDSVVGLSKTNINSAKNTFFAQNSKVYLNKTKIHSAIDAISLRNSFFLIRDSEFLTTIANSLKVLRDSQGIVSSSKIITAPQNKNSGRKGCPIFATSGATFKLVNNEIKNYCVNTAYEYSQNPNLNLNKKINWALSKFIRQQKILEIDHFNEVESLDLLINELIIDPKKAKKLQPSELQIINSLADKIMGKNRLINICMEIEKIDIDDSITRVVSDFLPLKMDLKKYDKVDKCHYKERSTVLEYFKIAKYVTKGIEALNKDYTNAVNAEIRK